MMKSESDPERAINLDASASQELKRAVVLRQTDEDPSTSDVIPKTVTSSIRAATSGREFLNQPFDADVRQF